MLDVVSYLFSELLYTVVAFLVRHQSGKLFEKLLQEIILFNESVGRGQQCRVEYF